MKRNEFIKKVKKVAKRNGFEVTIESEPNSDRLDFMFSQPTPAGQDFFFEISVEPNEPGEYEWSVFEDLVSDYYEGYDPSEEAYQYLDQWGHGTNGAPQKMGDVYEDFLECEAMLSEFDADVSGGYCDRITTKTKVERLRKSVKEVCKSFDVVKGDPRIGQKYRLVICDKGELISNFMPIDSLVAYWEGYRHRYEIDTIGQMFK